ncbi:MAG: phosphatidate cytidylyltransferase [Pseudomonadota bacterium]
MPIEKEDTGKSLSNWQTKPELMLKHRIITASVLIPLVLFTIFSSNATYFGLLIALFVIVAAKEWGRLLKLQQFAFIAYAILNAILLLSIYLLASEHVYLILAVTAAIFWCIALAIVIAYQNELKLLPKSRWLLLLLGQLLLTSTWSSLFYVKAFFTEGTLLVLFLILIIWSADSGAYFVGRSIGKRQLASRVSPGKTWEGVFGGFMTSILVSLVFVFTVSFNEIELSWVVLITLMTVIFSIVGDLFESILKRDADIKDSGNLLPGHGGALDRIDSLMAAGPFYALLCALSGSTT